MNAPAGGTAVLFDLDGTLVDSAPDIAASVDYALGRLGLRAPDTDRIRTYIGDGAARLMHRCLTDDIDGVADGSLFDSASAHFLAHYAANVCRLSATYPRVVETLTTLTGRGYALACVTNKPARFTRPLLEALRLDRFFPVTMSGDSLAAKKPAPDQLLYAADRCGVPPSSCTMVGDTATDLLAAKRAEMPAICVSYGYGDMSDILGNGPSAIVDSIEHIVDLLPQGATAR
jgi:phosphoglycolate phosphatase